jgi:hypothetical protein
MHIGSTKYTATRKWATHTTWNFKRPGQAYSMLSLPSWKDEKDKQNVIQNFHGGVKPSYKQLTANMAPSTADKVVNLNDTISVELVNKKAKPNVKKLFALFLDTITGNVFSYAAKSRGQAGLALLAYIQRFGKPHKLVHDNAQEFIHGEFKDI